MSLITCCKPFEILTPEELYRIIRLRIAVFVVEQNCVFQDLDNKDQHCHHLMLSGNDSLLAYARLVPPGIAYPEMSIGRIVTSIEKRRTGLGTVLVENAIPLCYDLFGKSTIKIGAQLYARKFYERFGFVQASATYLEDGIEHIEMTKEPA